MDRSSKRELAFKLIYSLEIQKQYDEETIELFVENNSNGDNKVAEYLKNIANGIIENNKETSVLFIIISSLVIISIIYFIEQLSFLYFTIYGKINIIKFYFKGGIL